MNKHHLKSNIVLIELIICILFFSICSAICVKTFAASYTISKKSASLTGSVLATQSIAEIYKSENGNLEKTAELLNVKHEETSVTLHYDKNWQKTEDVSTENSIEITEIDTNTANISAYEKGVNIFSINIKVPGEIEYER